MYILDANILLYAYNTSSANNKKAKSWIENNFYGKEIIGIPWVTTLAFIRISTNPRVLKHPFSSKEVTKIVTSWFEDTSVISVEPTKRHWEILNSLIVNFQVSANLTTDAHLAALCIEHNATICSSDLDFTRFKGLKVFNPIT